MANKDMLVAMYDKQADLQFNKIYPNRNVTFQDPKERTRYIKEQAGYMGIEVSEMLQELPFMKDWSHKELTYDEIIEAFNKARLEYFDVIHFVLNLGIGLGLTPEEIHDGFFVKQDINRSRQENGY